MHAALHTIKNLQDQRSEAQATQATTRVTGASPLPASGPQAIHTDAHAFLSAALAGQTGLGNVAQSNVDCALELQGRSRVQRLNEPLPDEQLLLKLLPALLQQAGCTQQCTS